MEIETRLLKLEKSNFHLKLVFLPTVLILSALVIVGQSAESKYSLKEVEATKFILKNPEGNIVGEWFGNRNGSTMLFYGGNPKIPPLMSIDIDQKAQYSRINMFDVIGKMKSAFSWSMDEENNEFSDSTSLFIRSSKSDNAISVGTNKGNSSVKIHDNNGKLIFHAP